MKGLFGDYKSEKNIYSNRRSIRDKLASKVISELNKLNPNIEYLSVGENLKKLGIKSIYDLRNYIFRIYQCIIKYFKIKKINETVTAIENFKPDMLLTVDSPVYLKSS